MPVLSYCDQKKIEELRKVQQNLLFNACEKGDLEMVKKIVEANKNAGDDWNTVQIKPDCAPQIFQNQNSEQITKDKLNVKPNIKWLIDAQCDTLWTPIMFAARYGHLSIVKYLAQEGARLENMTTYSPLHAACFGQNINVVRYLIHEKNCEVNPQTQEKTPLYIATSSNQQNDNKDIGLQQNQDQLISELLKAGAVYELKTYYPVNFGNDAPQFATDPEGEPNQQPQLQTNQYSTRIRFNDILQQKCQQFVDASSANSNQILQVKFNPILLAYFRGSFQPELDDRDVMEILKYI